MSRRRPAHKRLRRGILAALVTAFMPVVSAHTAAAYPTGTVELTGHGFGHGRGLSQWGSLGYALDYGWDYGQILGHYYGGTSAGSISAGSPMTVQLTRFDGQDLVATQGRGQLTTNVAVGSFRALRARLVGPNTFAVDQAEGCDGPWTTLAGSVAGPVVFSPSVTSSDDLANMVQACETDGSRRWLRGDLQALDAGGARTVNRLDMESYLRGVVPRETPASWGSMGDGQGMQALRAQAVAARSYAWTEGRASFAKTCDTTSCQVYGGVAVQAPGAGVTALEQPSTDAAVRETSGGIRTNPGGTAARTEFSSSSGGWTAGGAFPAVEDLGDARSPNHDWSAGIPVSTIESSFPAIGSLQSVDVTERNGLGDGGGRVDSVVLRGTSGSATRTGPELRGDFGLRSDWFFVLPPPSDHMDVFTRGTDNGIWQRSFADGRWSSWTTLGGVLASDPTAVSSSAGRIDVFAKGTDNGIWHRAFADGRWSGWDSIGGYVASGPDVASSGPGRLDVFTRGTDNGIWQRSFADGRWSSWTTLGGVLASDPTAVSSSAGRIDVFAKGTDNGIWHRAFADGRWSGWDSIGGYVASGPDASAWAGP